MSWTAAEFLALGENPTQVDEDALVAAAGSLYAGETPIYYF